MDKITKVQVTERLAAFCAQKGSQNKASNALNGVSAATISKILNGNDLESINDTMWRNIASQVGVKKASWNVVETSLYKRLTTLLTDAQENSLVFGVTAESGFGKSLTLKSYEEKNKEVYVLSCNEYWNRKMFLSELSQAMGREVAGLTVGEMMGEVVKELKSKDYPLLVLDEADKLTDQVMYFFITLYNKLEDHCGIMLIATDHLEKRVRSGFRHNRKGYKEIYSRIGRKFVKLGETKAVDIAEICIANGVNDKMAIKRIIEDSEGDLRRVKRMVFAELKKAAQEVE